MLLVVCYPLIAHICLIIEDRWFVVTAITDVTPTHKLSINSEASVSTAEIVSQDPTIRRGIAAAVSAALNVSLGNRFENKASKYCQANAKGKAYMISTTTNIC